MQTVLGANGPIGEELTRELYRTFTHDIRLVSRNPVQIHDTDQLLQADLTDPEATVRAVESGEIAYLTKFATRFPDFTFTTYREGITKILG